MLRREADDPEFPAHVSVPEPRAVIEAPWKPTQPARPNLTQAQRLERAAWFMGVHPRYSLDICEYLVAVEVAAYRAALSSAPQGRGDVREEDIAWLDRAIITAQALDFLPLRRIRAALLSALREGQNEDRLAGESRFPDDGVSDPVEALRQANDLIAELKREIDHTALELVAAVAARERAKCREASEASS